MHVHSRTVFVILSFLAFALAQGSTSSLQSASNPTPTTSTLASGSTSASGSSITSLSGASSLISGSPNGTFSITTTSSANYPSLSGYPTCVSQCLEIATSNANCTSVVSVNCYCNNTNFTNSIVSCVAQQCYNNIKQAETLAQQFCNLANYSTSLTFPSPPPTSSLASTSTAPTTSVTGPATSNAGVANAVAIDWSNTRTLVNMCVTIGGVILGAALL
ncbi:hypothetical protein SERLA73DRAFT_178346 [Serpula lacrymans var. lacrymans S7.3]|uniref:CFEM domain-containing protein n=1 Tax=Serpula lacrymans var. lacrymans (strain S7.3) TaxID=936435 RepID=F8PTI9_SERL3|nr:hypothetical protein SERLA73DRAFT_178346 [Serpula lacrymans var. lacrymans S7.3]